MSVTYNLRHRWDNDEMLTNAILWLRELERSKNGDLLYWFPTGTQIAFLHEDDALLFRLRFGEGIIGAAKET